MKLIDKPKYWNSKLSLRTVTIVTKQCTSKTYCERTHSTRVDVNRGLHNAFSFAIPATCGGGDLHRHNVARALIENNVTDRDVNNLYINPVFDDVTVFSIVITSSLRDVRQWGEWSKDSATFGIGEMMV